MRFNIKDNDEKNYDYMFLVMELIEIIGIGKGASNITIDEFKLNLKTITFILKVDDVVYDVSVSFPYEGKIANVILYRDNDYLSIDIDRKKKEAIRMIEYNYVNNCLLKTILNNDDTFIYEYFNNRLRKGITLKFKAKDELDDRLEEFLFQSDCNVENLVEFLKNNYSFINNWIIKVEEYGESKSYLLRDGILKEIDGNIQIGDQVKNKVYKYS